jgi:DNA gyrase/topoisomerase IV subunit B
VFWAEPEQDDPVGQESEPAPGYSAASIKVISFEDSVRRRPQMYFGCSHEDPDLMTAVARAVVADALYEPVAGRVRVTLVIESDLRFTVSVIDAVPGGTWIRHREPTIGILVCLCQGI